MASASRGVQSLEIGGRILKALANSNEPMMLKDLARLSGLGSAQCSTYLMSLCKTGLVQKDENSGLYRIGPFALRLGNSWLRSSALISAVIAATNTFSDTTGFATCVVIWHTLGPIAIHLYAGNRPDTINMRQGAVFSLTGSTIGRTFAAFGNIDDLDARIEAEMSDTVSYPSIGSPISLAEFKENILEVRKLGYASSIDKPIPGLSAISAPVYDADGQLAVVICLGGPSNKLATAPDSDLVKKFLAVSRTDFLQPQAKNLAAVV